ncbi:Eukaryotic translation initiation factor 6 [Astathelohania contejeani]|uniref:Eukaryotic translation initiation factor 6 n=1 Tax=Astathelohania contejeani TaxID=164912 RepID=A0ABQ7I1J5_9MICR|nr:Eukaryotic translation initiation factor 6 [Thelohania contejeani]
MSQRIHFEGSNEIGAYARLTSAYCLVGRSNTRHFYSNFQERLSIPLVETTINSIKTVGSLCIGNKNGLLVPATTTDQELQHIRNSLPERVIVRRISERLNALGNTVVCNDSVALIHAELEKETEEAISDVLGVTVYRQNIGNEPLVGSFAVLNNQGLLVHPHTTTEELNELSAMLEVQVLAGTVNQGSGVIGGGLVANDWMAFVGYTTTNTEITVIENVFNLVEGADEEARKKAIIEGIVK